MIQIKKIKLFLLILLIIPLANAQIENYNNYSSLTLNFKLSSNLTTIQGSNSELEYLTTDLFYYPLTSKRQEILTDNFITVPSANIIPGTPLEFTWTSLEDFYKFSLNSEIKTKNILYQVPHVSFPIQNLDDDYYIYTQPTEFIDINEDIIQQTASLVEGESDLFVATFKIADWVKNNIEYNLNTLTADVTQKSTWVMDTREGVCDEMTSLFISMLRSIGIPAKFVAGTVYTNIDYQFGNHGWAEVYFPGYGWVPYDVTFGQYGYLSPSHLKVTESFDSIEPSIEYRWKAADLEIEAEKLSLSTEITDVGSLIESPFDIQIKPLKSEVGPGSYVPIQIKIVNPYDKYVSTQLIITKSPDLLEDNVKQIVLKPNQEKSIFWITKIPKNINPNTIYTTTLEVRDYFYGYDTSSIKYSEAFDIISLSKAEEIIEKKEQQEEKSYSTELTIKCLTSQDYYYIYEPIEINCNLKNIGNTQINALKTCLDTNCQTNNFRIAEEKTFTFPVTSKESKEIIITSKNELIDVSSFVNLRVLEEPDLIITFQDAPESLEYNTNFDLAFILTTTVPINNIKISINKESFSNIATSQGSQRVTTNLNSKRFVTNPITLKLEYQDENGYDYTTEKQLFLEVTNVPWYIKIINKIKSWF